MSKIRKVREPALAVEFGIPPVVEVKAGQFKDRCLELLDQVGARAVELVVTKHGRPVARVVPIDAEAPSGFGFVRGAVLDQDDIVSPDFEAWGDLG